MKKLVIHLLVLLLLCMPIIGAAQQPDTLLMQNYILLKKIEGLMERSNTLQNQGVIDNEYAIRLHQEIKQALYPAISRQPELEYIAERFLKNEKKYGKAKWREKYGLQKVQNAIDRAFNFCEASNRILDVAHAFKSSKKVYFAKGKFRVPRMLRVKALEVYKPIMDSINAIVAAHPQLSYDVILKAIGYAHKSEIGEDAPLYAEVKKGLSYIEFAPAELPKHLSMLRATDVANILKGLTVYSKDKTRIDFGFESIGQATALPNKMLEYEENDERRRIVLVYWNILPKF